MTIRQYYWNDPGAPQISFSANSFNDVLRACLVTGYSSKPGAGWSEVFSSGTRRVFQCPGGRQRFYEFNDANSNYIYYRGHGGFDGGSGVGSDSFPTTGQSSVGYSIVKTDSSSTSVFRPWAVICSDRAMYFQIFYSHTSEEDTTLNISTGFVGDFVSYIPDDTGNSLVYGMSSASTASSGQLFGESLSFTAAQSGLSAFSDYIQMQKSFTNISLSPAWLTNSSTMGNSGIAFPDPGTGGLVLDPVRIMEYPDGTSNSRLVRGHMPGLFNPLHNNPGIHRGTFPGVGSLSDYSVVLWKKGRTTGKIAFSTNPADWL